LEPDPLAISIGGCNDLFYVWAKGCLALNTPKDVGFSVGKDTLWTHYMI